jgi:hypothetical protein
MRSSNPSFAAANRNIARAIADECDNLSCNAAKLFLDRLDIGENLAGVFRICQRVDRRDARVFRELLHVALRVCAEHRAVQHAAHYTRRVLDGFTATELDIRRAQKHRTSAEFSDADFK